MHLYFIEQRNEKKTVKIIFSNSSIARHNLVSSKVAETVFCSSFCLADEAHVFGAVVVIPTTPGGIQMATMLSSTMVVWLTTAEVGIASWHTQAPHPVTFYCDVIQVYPQVHRNTCYKSIIQ